MDFLQTLRAQVGGLLRIKSQLFWYGGRGWDGAPGRVCLVLDAAHGYPPAASIAAAETATFAADGATLRAATALLLIDGYPHWVWVGQEDVEIL